VKPPVQQPMARPASPAGRRTRFVSAMRTWRKGVTFAMGRLKHGKVPPPFPPHVAKHVDEARALYDIVKQEGAQGAAGIVQSEHALARLEFVHESGAEERDPYGPDSFPEPLPPGEGAGQ